MPLQTLIKLFIAAAALLVLTRYTDAFAATAELRVEGGNIIAVEDGQRRELTHTGRDDEPVLAPGGKTVVFTRKGKTAGARQTDDCVSGDGADQLRSIGVDGQGDVLLFEGRSGDTPDSQVCGFSDKQFTSDGAGIYFLSPAWATSAAVHVLDVVAKTEHFVLPGNDIVVARGCKGEQRDRLIVQQHRYFAFGGSYDWYWLFDAAGTTELGPVGDYDSGAAVLKVLDDSGQCGS